MGQEARSPARSFDRDEFLEAGRGAEEGRTEGEEVLTWRPLKGSRELRRRMKAIKTVFKPVGRSWAEDTKRLATQRVKVTTGKTRSSIRVRNASMKRATVEARHGGRFLEAGTQAHEIRAKRVQAMPIGNAGGQPQFAKKVKHPGMRKQPFMHNSARDALERNPMADELIKLWNQAA